MSAAFSLGLDGHGLDLFELWEATPGGEASFLAVSGTVADLGPLSPGDVIVKRRWAPAGEPIVLNSARRTEAQA